MLRNIGAVIVGLIAGMVINMILVQLNMLVFPLPEGVEWTDTEAFKQAIATMPAAGWILVFAAHLGQAFVGGWTAARLGASHPMMLAMIVGVLSLAGGIANAVMLSVPTWVWIEMPLYLVVAWLAGRIESARRGRATAAHS